MVHAVIVFSFLGGGGGYLSSVNVYFKYVFAFFFWAAGREGISNEMCTVYLLFVNVFFSFELGL